MSLKQISPVQCLSVSLVAVGVAGLTYYILLVVVGVGPCDCILADYWEGVGEEATDSAFAVDVRGVGDAVAMETC